MCDVQHQLVQVSYLFGKISVSDVSGNLIVVYVVSLADKRVGYW